MIVCYGPPYHKGHDSTRQYELSQQYLLRPSRFILGASSPTPQFSQVSGHRINSRQAYAQDHGNHDYHRVSYLIEIFYIKRS